MRVRSAKLKRNRSYQLHSDAYQKNEKFSGNGLLSKMLDKLFDLMIRRKYLKYYNEMIEVEEFVFDDRKQKLVTDEVIRLIQDYECDFYTSVNRDTHVIVCGETEFFDMINETRHNSPFHNVKGMNAYSLDIYRNGGPMGLKLHVCPGINGFAILPKNLFNG